MGRVRVVTVRVQDKSLFESVKLRGEYEHKMFKPLLEDIKKYGPVRAKNLEAKYGIQVFYILEKLFNSGMVEKTEEGYVLSLRFSEILRRFADEWEEFVKGGREYGGD